MKTRCKRHPIRCNSYSVHTVEPFGGQIIGVVTRKREGDWQAEGIGQQHIASGYRSRNEAVDAVGRYYQR